MSKTLSLQNVLGYTQSCGFIVASMSVCPNGTGISWITFSAAESSRFGSCSAPWLSPNCTRARQLQKRSVKLVAATKTQDWIVHYTTDSGPVRRRCWTTVSASGLSPWFAPIPRQAMRVGPCGWWPRKRSNANWSPGQDARQFGSCCKNTTFSRGGKKMWCIAELDDEYIKAMEDVLEVYERPLSAEEPVVCVDEKPVTLHNDVREPLPIKPGSVAKRDNEYERAGTANVFCGIEPQAGVHFTKVTPTRSSLEFADFIQSIANRYPTAQTIHLVMDNLSSHTQKALTDRFGEEEGGALWDRFTVHYPPVHGSWLNQAELEIGLFSKIGMGKRRLGEIRILRAEARAWNRRTNRNRVTINWTFDRKKARKKFKYKYNSKRPEA